MIVASSLSALKAKKRKSDAAAPIDGATADADAEQTTTMPAPGSELDETQVSASTFLSTPSQIASSGNADGARATRRRNRARYASSSVSRRIVGFDRSWWQVKSSTCSGPSSSRICARKFSSLSRRANKYRSFLSLHLFSRVSLTQKRVPGALSVAGVLAPSAGRAALRSAGPLDASQAHADVRRVGRSSHTVSLIPKVSPVMSISATNATAPACSPPTSLREVRR